MILVSWILAGAFLGSAASAIFGIRDRQGFLLNIVIGVAGVMGSRWLLAMLIGTSAFESGDYDLASLLVSLLGASVPLAALRLYRGVVESKPRALPDEASVAFGTSNIENPNAIADWRSNRSSHSTASSSRPASPIRGMAPIARSLLPGKLAA